MKKILIATLILFSMIPVLNAQDEIQEIQDEWGKEKKELVRLAMELIPEDSIKFWPIYTKYEVERKKIGRERILILNDYAENYYSITNAKADELVNRIFKNDALMTKLQQTYYTNVKTRLNAMQAAKFLHIETYLTTTIRSALQGALPLIGQLDSLRTH